MSLFNGMNTGRVALEDLGIYVQRYFSSEIKEHAIKLTQHHYPDTIQLGDVRNWRNWDIDWQSIDLVLSGSPCQDLSKAGKRAGLNGKNSSLFFIFVDILNHIRQLNPDIKFLQENVGSASLLDIGIMSRALGVYPVRINSSLLTAQLRDRYYWTNIKTRETIFDSVTDIPQPTDLGIMFKDIITDGFTDREKSFCLLEGYISKMPKQEEQLMKDRYTKGMLQIVYIENNEVRIKSNTNKGYEVLTENDCLDLAYHTSKTRRARVTKGKSPCLMEAYNNLFSYRDGNIRTLNKTELCRLQGFPDDYCDILTLNKASSLLGDGWTLPVIKHIFSFIQKPNNHEQLLYRQKWVG